MATPLEAQISLALREQGDVGLVAEDLVGRWRRNLLSEPEQVDCAQFLLATGFYPMLFQEIYRLIKSGARLPWAQFAEALGRAGVNADEYEVQAIFDGADLQESIPDLLRSRQLDLMNRSFAEKRASLHSKKSAEINERKQMLRDKLKFMQAHRMFEQEAQVLEEFQALFPGEDDIKVEKDAFQLRWAREIVAKSTSATDPTADLAWRADRLTPEQSSAKSLIIERAKELVAADPSLAYDFAAMLGQMDFNAEAIEILELGPATYAGDWLKLDLMLRARQFVAALDEAAKLEHAYADEPDSSFAAVYARARALHGLGQTDLAAEQLKSIVRLRPHYKSAQSLLRDWLGDEWNGGES